MFLTWGLWKEVNNRVFRDTTKNSKELCISIRKQIQENIENYKYAPSKKIPSYQEMRIKKLWVIYHDLTNVSWVKQLIRRSTSSIPSNSGWIKCNLDGCSKGNLGLARAGGIVRDH